MKVESLVEVEKVVAEIGQCRGDDERAHALEDELYEAILRYAADGNYGELREMAYAALGTKEIDFEGWCA